MAVNYSVSSEFIEFPVHLLLSGSHLKLSASFVSWMEEWGWEEIEQSLLSS